MELHLPNRASPKLYDGRFSHEYCQKWYAVKWAPQVERGLFESSRSMQAKAFLQKWANLEFELGNTCDAVIKRDMPFCLLCRDYVRATDVYDELREY